jgi:hypothetical protein
MRACVYSNLLAHATCRSRLLFGSVRNTAACFRGLEGNYTSSTSPYVQIVGSPRGPLREVRRRGRVVRSPSLCRVTGYIEERDVSAWARMFCASRQSPRHPPCLEKCFLLQQYNGCRVYTLNGVLEGTPLLKSFIEPRHRITESPPQDQQLSLLMANLFSPFAERMPKERNLWHHHCPVTGTVR